MKLFRILFLAALSAATAFSQNQLVGNLTVTGNARLNGNTTISGPLNGTPTGGTLNLSALSSVSLPANEPYARVFNILAYGGSGAGNTTTTGGISSASATLTLASASTFSAGHGVMVLGAGSTQRSVADGVTSSGNTTVTSATIAFAADDVGKVITGSGISANTTIASINSTTSAVLSAAPSATATGVTFAIKANLVTTISALNGTTATLAANASTTVSGARVYHDETAAINSAILAVIAAGGGTVYFPNSVTADGSGMYNCFGAFNGTTNGIITFPDLGYGYNPIQVKLVGETRGTLANYESALAGGVMLNFTQHPKASGSYPSAIAAGTYGAANLSGIDVWLENIAVVVESNPTITGVRLVTAENATIGNNVRVSALAASAATWTPPSTNTSVGIWMPPALNNVLISVGSCWVEGFYTGIIVGEHTWLSRPQIFNCYQGLKIAGGFHPITGVVSIEHCRYNIVGPDAAIPLTPVDLTLSLENLTDTGQWNSTLYDIYDPNSAIGGKVAYELLSAPGYFINITTSGTTNLSIRSLVTDAETRRGPITISDTTPTVTLLGNTSIMNIVGALEADLTIQDSGATTNQQAFNLVSNNGTLSFRMLSDDRLSLISVLGNMSATGALAMSGAISGTGLTSSGNASVTGRTTTGHLIVNAASPAFVASSMWIDWNSGGNLGRIYTIGGNATTNGLFSITSVRSDGSNSLTVMSTDSSGNSSFRGVTGTSLTSSGTLGVTGASTLSGALITGVQALSGAGAVDVVTPTTALTTTGGSQALTLANGTNGQIKTIIHDVDGGSAILTPTTKTGFSTVTFTNVGDTVTLEYLTTRGWFVLASYGAVVAP